MAPADRAASAPLVDTHCHVDLFPDPAALVQDIERRRVYTMAAAAGIHRSLPGETRGEDRLLRAVAAPCGC